MKTNEEINEYAHNWRKKNREKSNEASRKHRQRLREGKVKKLEFCSRPKCTNRIPDSMRTNALYCSKNCSALARVAKYKARHPERVAANVKNWRENNLDKRKEYEKVRYWSQK